MIQRGVLSDSSDCEVDVYHWCADLVHAIHGRHPCQSIKIVQSLVVIRLVVLLISDVRHLLRWKVFKIFLLNVYDIILLLL